MQRKTLLLKVFFCFFGIVLMICQQPLQSKSSQSKYSVEEVRRVFQAIDQLEQEQLKNNQRELKSITVTESELNSYFAYRIEVEKEDVLKQLHFKIFENNKIEGKILIDLRGQKIPGFLQPEMNIYFAGRVEVENGKVHILLKKLFLEEEAIQPQVLDAIIFMASKFQNYEPSSLSDWYELPFGIKDIKTKKQQAIFFY